MAVLDGIIVNIIHMSFKIALVIAKRDGVCNPVPNVFTMSELRDYI